MRHRITPKAAETWIPSTIEDIVGNYGVLRFMGPWTTHPDPTGIPNVLVLGTPGTAKTASSIWFLRTILKDPTIGFSDDFGLLTEFAGKVFGFARINGRKCDERSLNRKLDQILACDHHVFVLMDELGELYAAGLDEAIRPVLDSPHVSTVATAQNLHGRRRSDTPEEDEARRKALLRRFRKRVYTELPTESELVAFLERRMDDWGIAHPDSCAAAALARKAGLVPGLALNCLVDLLSEADPVLTAEAVAGYQVDPLLEF